METLLNFFGHVCGQQIDHTWVPAGLPLPVCERCTGLYVGAALALTLLLMFRPRIEGWFLWLHGLFLAGMAPFGFHWIDHGPDVRTITGLLFGAAVMVFLAYWPIELLRQLGYRHLLGLRPALRKTDSSSTGFPPPPPAGAWLYLVVLGLATVTLPVLCRTGTSGGAYLLLTGIAVGGLGFVLLLLLNVLSFAWWLGQCARVASRPLPP